MRRVTFIVSVILIILIVGGCSIIRKKAAATYNTYVSQGPYDVIIVPGLPFDTVDSKSNILFKARIFWAKYLYNKGIAKHIIFSGSAVHSPYVEGEVMKMLADSMGIPSDKTFIEDKALHSTENIDYGIQLANSLGFHKIAVASDPFQCLFLQKYITSKNYSVGILPFNLDSMKSYNRPLPRIDVEKAFVRNFVPLDERSETKKM